MQRKLRRAMAIAAHPDDIEFMMAGTLFLLKEAGVETHYLNIANGCCGTQRHRPAAIAAIRRREAMAAARAMGAVFHGSLVNDLEIFYERKTLFRLSAILREIAPDIILTHYPFDYMEDHSNTCRLAVSAAFFRGMSNCPVIPPTPPVDQDMTVYHAMPYGLRDPLNRCVVPDFVVDISDVIDNKTAFLARHRSQKEWLDVSQGLDAYLDSMREQSREAGVFSKAFSYAEGWTRHLHLGLCTQQANPLCDLLGKARLHFC